MIHCRAASMSECLVSLWFTYIMTITIPALAAWPLQRKRLHLVPRLPVWILSSRLQRALVGALEAHVSMVN